MAEREVVMGPAREDALMPAIAATLQDASATMADVRAIACGSGPGSFTSLRIAAALSKGLAQASQIPLYAIPSMLLAALELRAQSGSYVLHGDALRGERFAQRFDVGVVAVAGTGGIVTAIGGMVRMVLADVEQWATSQSLVLVAIGSTPVSACDARSAWPRARNAAALATVWESFRPVDLAAWEPDYGRLAEAQVKWEETHQRALPTG